MATASTIIKTASNEIVVKILCIAGSIVLGSILLSGQAFGKAPSDLITLSAPKEPEGQYVSYDIDGLLV